MSCVMIQELFMLLRSISNISTYRVPVRLLTFTDSTTHASRLTDSILDVICCHILLVVVVVVVVVVVEE
jgi:hypothetical protein